MVRFPGNDILLTAGFPPFPESNLGWKDPRFLALDLDPNTSTVKLASDQHVGKPQLVNITNLEHFPGLVLYQHRLRIVNRCDKVPGGVHHFTDCHLKALLSRSQLLNPHFPGFDHIAENAHDLTDGRA